MFQIGNSGRGLLASSPIMQPILKANLQRFGNVVNTEIAFPSLEICNKNCPSQNKDYLPADIILKADTSWLHTIMCTQSYSPWKLDRCKVVF